MRTKRKIGREGEVLREENASYSRGKGRSKSCGIKRHVHAHVRIIGRAKHHIRALVWRDSREVPIPPPLQFIDDKVIDELQARLIHPRN